MDDLIAFLLARLAEMEEPAIEVRDKHRGEDSELTVWIIDDDYRHDRLGAGHTWVLADIAAKRKILELATRILDPANNRRKDDQGGLITDPMARYPMRHVLRLLAQPFAGHPDFREEWRP